MFHKFHWGLFLLSDGDHYICTNCGYEAEEEEVKATTADGEKPITVKFLDKKCPLCGKRLAWKEKMVVVE